MKRLVKKIPKFKSYQEEAKFWDTHSIADFKKELKKTKLEVKKPLKMTFTVRLDPKTVKELDSVAKEKGVGPRTLARMWLLEKLKEEYYTIKSTLV